MKNKVCPNCGKIFEPKSNRTIFCCKDCGEIYESKQKFKDIDGVIVCQECGMMGHNLLKHIGVKHVSIDDYCSKHNCSRNDLISKQSHNNLSVRQKELIKKGILKGFTSENNPSKSIECKNGRNSPYSKNFRGYDNLTDDEKEKRIKELYEQKSNTTNNKCNNPKKIEYYISRGYSKEEAEEKLHKSQQTFSLDICIQKYGANKGKQIWLERQEKWINNYPKNNYSMISQELFDQINEYIKDDDDVYYATNKNGEYVLKSKTKIYKLDFFIKHNKKVIEFDGDYWHNQSNPEHKKRDNKKTNDIKNMGYQILRIKEKDYRKNPQKILQECIEFLGL